MLDWVSYRIPRLTVRFGRMRQSSWKNGATSTREMRDNGVPLEIEYCAGWPARYCARVANANVPAKFRGEESSSVSPRNRKPNFSPCARTAMVVKFCSS